MQFLIKWPTRSRPAQFARCIGKWIDELSWKHLVHFLVNQDVDDPARLEVYQRAADLRGPGLAILDPDSDPNWAPDSGTRVILEFIEGSPQTKIEAVNFGMEGREFDILVNASDDMWPEVANFDDVIAQEMQRHWPALDGALNFWDGSPGPRDLSTLSVMGIGLFKRFGYIYHPAYVSLYADDEYTQACRLMGKMADPESFTPGGRVLVRHKHPAMYGGKSTYDALMKRNESFYAVDEKTFRERKARNFEVETVAAKSRVSNSESLIPSLEPWRPTLSILICGLECRRALSASLLRALHAQQNALEHPDDVEIICHVDAGEKSVGAKRNELLARASKEWICFFDDDDRPFGDYLDKILAALEARPDCVGITGICTMNAHQAFTRWTSVHIFRHGLEFGGRQQTAQTVTHRPFPISVFRAALAKQVRFPEINLQEDDAWATALRPLLKTGVTIFDPIYHYDWRADRTTTQASAEVAKARAAGRERAWEPPRPGVRAPRPAPRVPPPRAAQSNGRGASPGPPGQQWGLQRVGNRPALRPPPSSVPERQRLASDVPAPTPPQIPEA